jgi:hypothetical protein
MGQDFNETIVRKFLSDPGKIEVLAWLRAGGAKEQRTLGEMSSQEDSLALAEEIYSAGAEKVFAVGIREYVKSDLDGDLRCQNTGKLLVALPADPRARKKVFRWQAKQARALGFDGTPDTGQQYLFVALD